MSEGMWASVIGGVATIVAAIITVWAVRPPVWPWKVLRWLCPNCSTDREPTEFGHKRIWKEMRNGAVLEERDGKPVLLKDGVDLLYPQKKTISGMESGGFIRQETTTDGKKRWLLA